jgi:hypothetical protein
MTAWKKFTNWLRSIFSRKKRHNIMAQGIIATGCVYRIVDSSGSPLSGAKLYTYEAGTTTPLPVYTDGGLTTPATNPVIMNANGEATFWYGLDDYKLIEKTSADVTLRTVDNVSGNFLTKAAADALYFPIAGPVDLSGSVLTGAIPLSFEGATSNAYETSLAITDPTADRTVTIQDKSGTIAYTSGEVFANPSVTGTLAVNGELAVSDTATFSGAVTVSTSDAVSITSISGVSIIVLGVLTLNASAIIATQLHTSTSYANDAAAAAGGVVLGQFYRNGSVVMIRVA